jgi:hypothetical protein
MDAHSTSASTVRGLYSHLVIYESIHPTSVSSASEHSTFRNRGPVHLNIPPSETGALKKGLKIQNSNFLENISNNSDYISVIYGHHVPK